METMPRPQLSRLYTLALTTLIAFARSPIFGQSEPSLSCAADLSLLERTMHLDYAGYTMELRGQRLRDFAAMKATAQVRADSTRGDSCYDVLRDFVEWFDDPHLFLYERARIDTAETARRAASVERRPISESSARTYFRDRGLRLDPIEGIWYDRGLRLAVVPDSSRLPNGYLAIVLSADTSIWPAGAVRARITRGKGNAYDVALSTPTFAVVHRRGTIYRHVLLRLSPGIWGKEFPVAPPDSGTLDSVDPHRPVLYRRNGTMVFAIPSHDGFRGVIDSLVNANRDALAHADRMIVDLRGNEGGGSQMTESLEPFISLVAEKPSPFPTDGAFMLSSEDQIDFARRGFGAETTAFVRSLVERLRAHPGELVPLEDPLTPARAPRARDWVVASGPRAVGVLIDRGTVSASEVLVLTALRSARATVFGEPTAGALDYQTASIVSISPREKRWYLGYGTITRSRELPRGGMRGHGIPPQVRLDLSRVSDPVGYVDRALMRPR
jgi:Peptidase family S41